MTDGPIDWKSCDPEIRHAEALKLRARCKTYEEIASILQYAGRQGAQEAVRAALRLCREEDSETIRGLDVARLDKMIGVLMVSAEQGHLEAIDRVIKLMARKSALFGLDAPQKIAQTDPDGKPMAVVVVPAQFATMSEWMKAYPSKSESLTAPQDAPPPLIPSPPKQ